VLPDLYRSQAGDESSDLTVKSIAVSGTISDATDQAMLDFSIGSNLASSSAIVVDGLNPTIASIKVHLAIQPMVQEQRLTLRSIFQKQCHFPVADL
jgi:hypothetical protein